MLEIHGRGLDADFAPKTSAGSHNLDNDSLDLSSAPVATIKNCCF